MKTKLQCQEILKDADCYEYEKNKYCTKGRYVLSHGEYDSPMYNIRKRNKINSYYIYATYYYYTNAMYAQLSRDVTSELMQNIWA